jgi:hypothetical protein
MTTKRRSAPKKIRRSTDWDFDPYAIEDKVWSKPLPSKVRKIVDGYKIK